MLFVNGGSTPCGGVIDDASAKLVIVGVVIVGVVIGAVSSFVAAVAVAADTGALVNVVEHASSSACWIEADAEAAAGTFRFLVRGVSVISRFPVSLAGGLLVGGGINWRSRSLEDVSVVDRVDPSSSSRRASAARRPSSSTFATADIVSAVLLRSS
jgi:hypothetical protein